MNFAISRNMRLVLGSIALSVALAMPASAQEADHPSDKNLVVACDLGFAPFCFKNASGEVTGFTYDLSAEIAKRLGRPGLDVIDTNYSAIFAGLYSKRYEMIPAPTNITKERAAQMLFSEPYMPTGIGFLTKKDAEIKDLKELKGKAITVNNGSISDKWLTDHEAEYGFTIQRYNKNADAVQAVMIGRGFANAADVPVSRYVAKQTPAVKVAYVVSTGRDFGIAFRKDDKEFRAKVEKVMECMKKDGGMAAIYKKWFGVEPEADSSVVKIYPGIGAPGFEGYDASEHELACKS